MKIRQLAKLSTRMFRARTSRTFLTILGMGVGIGAILFLVGLGYGVQRSLLSAITTDDALMSLDVSPAKSGQTISPAQVATIKNIPGVEEVSPAYEEPVKIKTAAGISDAEAMIVAPRFLDLDGTKTTAGKSLNNNAPEDVLITSTLAKIFGQSPAALVGQKIELAFSNGGPENYVSFRIAGAVDGQDSLVYVNTAAPGTAPAAGYSRLKVKCASSAALAGVRTTISNSGLAVSSVSDVIAQADKVFTIAQMVLAFFGLIALLVSAIGMFNTMTITLLERTEEIGIMKSIGASRRNIMAMFITEATVMGFLGGIAGVILAYLASWAVNGAVNFIAVRLGGASMALFYFPLWFLSVIILLATLVGFLTGVIPAKRASSTDPLEALRYK